MATYKIDPAHSEILFKVKHLMITNVTGNITKFDASMQSDKPDFSDASITFQADTDSVTTNNEQRDVHLKSDDFFNAEKFPKLTFYSNAIKKISEDEYKLKGNLTIRDISKQVELNVIHTGTVIDPWGQTKDGFEITGKISRKEYGLKWNAVTEAGGLVVSDDVKLLLNIQMIKQG